MNLRDNHRYDMFGRVENFGKENAADFSPETQGGRRFAAITQILRDIERAHAGQQLGRAAAKDALLDALRQDFRKVLRTARAVAQDEPGFAESFRAPENDRQAALVAAVDAILLELDKPDVAAKFIAHHLPGDFIQQFAAKRQAVVDAQDEMESEDHGGVTSTAAITRLTRAGMKEVKYLDAIVRNQYPESSDQLRGWVSARTVERPARRKRPAASHPTTGAMPAISSPTAGAEPAAPAAQEPGRIAV